MTAARPSTAAEPEQPSSWAAKMSQAADALTRALAGPDGDRIRLVLTIEGPSITADDWDGPNLKPGVLERFDAQLAAMVDHLRSLT